MICWRVLVALAFPLLAVAAPPGATDVVAGRLGQLLRDLDRDQMRQVGASAEAGSGRFSKVGTVHVRDLLVQTDGAVYVAIGRRGSGIDAPLDLRSLLRVEGQGAANLRITSDPTAYVANEARGDWGASLVALGRARGVESVTPEQALARLASSGDARFVVKMKTGDAGTIDALIVLPDTELVTIGGRPSPGAADAESRALPRDPEDEFSPPDAGEDPASQPLPKGDEPQRRRPVLPPPDS